MSFTGKLTLSLMHLFEVVKLMSTILQVHQHWRPFWRGFCHISREIRGLLGSISPTIVFLCLFYSLVVILEQRFR